MVDNPYDEIEPGSYSNVIQTLDEAIKHGQETAGVAAAKRNETGMHGVAYDSKIEFVSFQNETFNKEIEDQYASGLFNVEIEGRDARAINYLNTRVPIAFSAAPGFYDWSDSTPEETETEGDNNDLGYPLCVKLPHPLPIVQSGFIALATTRTRILSVLATSRSISPNLGTM